MSLELMAAASSTALENPAASGRMLESSPIHFQEEATAYDAMVRRHAWLLNRPFVKMLSASGLKRGRALDIGTGPGWIPIELALRHPGLEIWAIDASPDMLDAARAHAASAGVAGRIRFIHADALSLPFEARGFDLTFSHFMLHHLPHPHRFFDEVDRVTSERGRVLIKDLLRQPAWKMALLLGFSRRILRYNELQLRMYRESMHAALTYGELQAQLRRSRLADARIQGFRGLDYVIAR